MLSNHLSGHSRLTSNPYLKSDYSVGWGAIPYMKHFRNVITQRMYEFSHARVGTFKQLIGPLKKQTNAMNFCHLPCYFPNSEK